MIDFADEYSKSEKELCEQPDENGEWDVECTNCGHRFVDPLPLLYDDEKDEHFHGCPYCMTDGWLRDLKKE